MALASYSDALPLRKAGWPRDTGGRCGDEACEDRGPPRREALCRAGAGAQQTPSAEEAFESATPAPLHVKPRCGGSKTFSAQWDESAEWTPSRCRTIFVVKSCHLNHNLELAGLFQVLNAIAKCSRSWCPAYSKCSINASCIILGKYRSRVTSASLPPSYRRELPGRRLSVE